MLRPLLMLTMPALFLTGCMTKPQNSPRDWQQVNAPAVPQLPAEAAGTTGSELLAELFRRADQRAGELAAIADQARIRGLTCEAAYDALTGASAVEK